LILDCKYRLYNVDPVRHECKRKQFSSTSSSVQLVKMKQAEKES